MILQISLLVVGFVLLIQGANWIINGASQLARKYKVSELVIGLTIVAFGTSAPELVVNGLASSQNQPDIVLGNVIGSNIFNLFAILGIVGLIYPITVQINTVKKEIPISFIAALVFLILANDFFSSTKEISRIDGIILLMGFGGFLYYIFKQMKNDTAAASTAIATFSNTKIWLFIAMGLAGAVLGGKLIVDNAVNLATSLGISQKVISLTIIAAGTSLPELVTSGVAAFKKKSDLAIGNIIGSNIFNILLILGTSATIQPIAYKTSYNFNLYFLLGGTLFLVIAMITGKKFTLDRWEAIILLLSYIIVSVYAVSFS